MHAWAVKDDLPKDLAPVSNTFEMEWPPRSGNTAEFPEIDEIRFFPIAEARKRIHPNQEPFLDRLLDVLA